MTFFYLMIDNFVKLKRAVRDDVMQTLDWYTLHGQLCSTLTAFHLLPREDFGNLTVVLYVLFSAPTPETTDEVSFFSCSSLLTGPSQDDTAKVLDFFHGFDVAKQDSRWRVCFSVGRTEHSVVADVTVDSSCPLRGREKAKW